MSLAKVFCSWSIAAVLLLLSIAFSSSAESEKTGEPIVTVLDENGEEGNGTTTNVTLTGNPQIDYVHDPNLPRELNGYNLSDYPFFSRVPKTINFSCDGRKDGFYSNVEHKCQVYHHCLYETRHDFLCANYTAFDQRTFICQFVSEVDCPNSHMFFHRNKDLYITKTTTTIAPVYDRGLYERRRPQKKPKSRLRPAADDDGGADTQQQTTAAPDDAALAAPPPPKRKDVDYADEEYYDDDDYGDYAVRRPARPRRRFRKCRNGRRRGRRCRGRRPAPVYDYDDYTYDDDYDYAYYDGARPRKPGKKRRPQNAIPAGTSQVTSTSSSETPAPTSTTSSTTTTTTTTTRRPPTTTTTEAPTGPLDSESVTFLQNQRDELLAKTRRPSPFLRPGFRPSRQNDKSRTTTSTSTTSTTTTTTERAKPTTTGTTTTTTEVPQYIYDYEYYEDDSPVVEASSTTTTTTTAKPSYFRGKIRGGNSAAALLEKQRVQQSIQVRVTEDSGTNTNTIRRRDNSQVQTPTRVATLPSSSTTSTTTTTTSTPPSTQTPNRPSRFWQRKSTVKIVSTTATPSTTTTTAAPYYQDYQDYEDTDVADPQPSVQPQTAPAAPLQQSSKFQPLLHPTHQYGTSPAAVSQRPQSYANTASSPSQPPSTSPRGHGSSGSSLSSSSYARPNKPYTMQQYSQSSSSSSSSSINNNNSNSNNNNNYNTNSYHRQRSPTPSVPKPEFISLVDEDYNNPYVSPVAVAPTSPSSTTRLHGGSQGGASSGYHQHPIRFFEQQHQPPAFLFGAASEYNSPQFAFPPRNYPSPSNFQPYGHSTRRFSAHFV